MPNFCNCIMIAAGCAPKFIGGIVSVHTSG
jgi:hypothetical protein